MIADVMPEFNPHITSVFWDAESEGGSGTSVADADDGKTPAGGDDDKTPAVGDDGKTPAGDDDAKKPDEDDDKGTKPRTIAGGDWDDETSESDDAADSVTYEAFDVPEGMQLNGPLLEKATPLFSELGLDQTKAQQVVSFYAELKREEDVANVEAFKQQQDAYVAAVKEDPDFGGDNFVNTRKMASFVVKKFGGEELQALLDETGFGNHPTVVKALARIGAQFTENGVVLGDSKATKEDIPMAKRWYKNMSTETS